MSGDNGGGYVVGILGTMAATAGAAATYLAAKLGVIQKRQKEDARVQQTAADAEVAGRQNLLLGWERIAADRQKEIDNLREVLRKKDEEITHLWQSVWSHQRDSIDAQAQVQRLRDEIAELEGRLNNRGCQ